MGNIICQNVDVCMCRVRVPSDAILPIQIQYILRLYISYLASIEIARKSRNAAEANAQAAIKKSAPARARNMLALCGKERTNPTIQIMLATGCPETYGRRGWGDKRWLCGCK